MSIRQRYGEEWLERRGEELERDITTHALYRPSKSAAEFLERWRPEPGQLPN